MKLLEFIRRIYRQIHRVWNYQILERLDVQRLQLGQSLALQVRHLPDSSNIQEAEFKAFSQTGEDGIIQYLISRVSVSRKEFIEFGTEDYREANTRFLLMNDCWRGLIIDAGGDHLREAEIAGLLWKYGLTAAQSFITRENVNQLFLRNGFEGQIGLLSIDVDGNDYWVWKEISCVDPDIVIVEYNAVFGSDRAVTIPYDAKFSRSQAHYSNLYWGASLGAFSHLAEGRGYVFVGCNKFGNNAFFVKQGKASRLPQPSLKDGFVPCRFRESRDCQGRFSFLSGGECLREIGDLPLIDVKTNEQMLVRDLIGDTP